VPDPETLTIALPAPACVAGYRRVRLRALVGALSTH
jgi:hypothetical protein